MRADQLADPAILEHYRQLAGKLSAMAPLCQLVERLCGKDYATALPAATSHDALVIGAEDGDMVSVDYWPAVQTFGVCYRHRRTSRLEKHTGDAGMAERLVDSLALRMIIRERYHEAT